MLQGQPGTGAAQVSEERKVGEQPGKVVRCAGGSFVTKYMKGSSSRTCPEGGEVKVESN